MNTEELLKKIQSLRVNIGKEPVAKRTKERSENLQQQVEELQKTFERSCLERKKDAEGSG